ncbi:DUF2460 domain-containing protein [Aquisediminimonas sediminicola]|uniref:DUF2460 domain-containing protein n=1 Tax=Alteraquisediminimonas sediminicola TaxID=2676787 RepID=UPI001C8DD0FD|nr:DUF2460 domain-containing protein [Aquisediminimonas sediminicola]
MGYWLARAGDALAQGWLKRFDPRFWTVNFPRPMMASVTTNGFDALRVDVVFYKANDLAGLIWDAVDHYDHPLLAYATNRDFRGCKLQFRWRSGGIIPLNQLNGPVLTIEGRDQNGTPRSWYVRLWNYAKGSATDAVVSLDFDAMAGGFLLPREAVPVWAGDIDRMFISLVPPGYDAGGASLPGAVEGWAEMSGIRCDGPGSMLALGDMIAPEHGLRIATGYDDSYNLTPERMLRNIRQLGYRGTINHYVGMSHYFRLEPASGGHYVSLSGGVLNAPCSAWHHDFAARARTQGYEVIWSLSYELFDAHCWNDWKQRDLNGVAAQTGWVPPSTLLSPAHQGAMGYLQAVARAFCAIAGGAGLRVQFQVGEPWWWTTNDGRVHLYDEAAKAVFGGNPVAIADVRGAMTAAQTALLDKAGAVLAASTAALTAAVRLDHPDAVLLILVYLPTVLDEAAPALKRANVPLGWARPAFDVLQFEDYDWVTANNAGLTARGTAVAGKRLGYPVSAQHYFAGFVLLPADKAQWAQIDAAAEAGRARGVAETFIWALPQVMRDGYFHFDEEDGRMQAFDDVAFPLALGREATIAPQFSTAIVTTASGAEQRNAEWADARLQIDAGPGLRSEADIETLITFIRARHGAARGFRFRDPFDFSSNHMTDAPGVLDQQIGIGDGKTTAFDLVKNYGIAPDYQHRRITRPLTGSVRIALAGVEILDGWTLRPKGVVSFDIAPAAGVPITAGFLFEVPVRFAEDRLEVSRATFRAGEAASVPMVEVREG